jgi:repressor LexA
MHPIQEKLLKIIDRRNIGHLTLREIGGLVGETLPQKIKHHLIQLERKGFIFVDKKTKNITRVNKFNSSKNNSLISLPIVGAANCGPQTIYADQNIEGYLKISKKLITKTQGVFVLRAEGNSLNKANVKGKTIESGDYIIVDSDYAVPRNNDYIVSVIGGLANVKKYLLDSDNSRIILLSESTQHFDPIFIHEDDDFQINGKVIDVVKKPNL